MSKGFKFKLQPVLRLRELREEEVKGKLGVTIGRINDQFNMINKYKDEIQFYFDRYEKSESVHGDMTAGLRNYMPEFLLSHYRKINQCKKEVERLISEKDELIKKLNEAKGQVKIFTNLREKKLSEYKIKMSKKINNQIEELSILKGNKNG